MTEWLHFRFSFSCIGEGNGNPLQCSCLENPRDGGAWWAAVCGVAQSRTWLKRLSSSSSQVSLDFLVLHSNPLWWKGHLFVVSVLEGLVGLYRTGQLRLLWHQWLGKRLGLLWCWMVCFENKLRSFYPFWDCTQALHFRLLLTVRATAFFLRDPFPL